MLGVDGQCVAAAASCLAFYLSGVACSSLAWRQLSLSLLTHHTGSLPVASVSYSLLQRRLLHAFSCSQKAMAGQLKTTVACSWAAAATAALQPHKPDSQLILANGAMAAIWRSGVI